MLKILRATNGPVLVRLIEPVMLEGDVSKDVMLDTLQSLMRDNPNAIYAIVAVDVTTEKCHGYGIVTAPQGQLYTWVEAAWCDERGSAERVMEQFMVRVNTWTQYIGRNEVRFETRRVPESIGRKYGFKPLATIMHLVITPESEQDVIEQLVAEKLSRGTNDGRQLTTSSEHTLAQSETGGQVSVVSDPSAHRSESVGIQRGASGTTGASVQPSPGISGPVQSVSVSEPGNSSSDTGPERESVSGPEHAGSGV